MPIDIDHLIRTKPQHEWTDEEGKAVAADQEARRRHAMGLGALIKRPRYDEELTADQIAYLHELADEERRQWKERDRKAAIAHQDLLAKHRAYLREWLEREWEGLSQG